VTRAACHGLILPVVLVLIGLLALTLASFMFFINAEISGIQAQRDAQQARLTAESGLEEVITVIRAAPDDPTAWFDVPDKFRHALVWAETYTREEDPVKRMGNRKETLALAVPPVAWRYSVVAENLDGPPQTFRYGITPEAGKLNLNTASDAEIDRLLTPLLQELRVENAPELVAALLDWRDTDDEPRSGGAESEYYTNLDPAYKTKNGPLDSLEELLLVKGWTAAMLYGEDTNRNGLLDANEDDGDASFPHYDNGDGVLQHGIAPYVTVWSREPGAPAQAPGPAPGETPEAEQGSGEQQSPSPDQGGQGVPPDNGQVQPQEGAPPAAGGKQPGVTPVPPVGGPQPGPQAGGKQPGGRQPTPSPGGKPPVSPPAPGPNGPGAIQPQKGQPPARQPGSTLTPAAGGAGKKGGKQSNRAPGEKPPATPGNTTPAAPGDKTPGAPGPGPVLGQTPGQPAAGSPAGTPGTTQPQGSTPQAGQMRGGRLNVNTAPLRVLQALDGMPAGAAEAIVAARQELAGDALQTTDWLVTSGALDAASYAQIKDRITTRALQFHVEIVAYGDHTKLVRRYEWIIEMRGTVGQVLYHRDLTGLGYAWPVDDDKVLVKGR
jgi:type II secretory pathway component PulK